MIALIQRVKQASVTVDEQIIGQIKHGLLVLLGVEQGDDEQKASRLCEKMLGYRVFSDNESKCPADARRSSGGITVYFSSGYAKRFAPKFYQRRSAGRSKSALSVFYSTMPAAHSYSNRSICC